MASGIGVNGGAGRCYSLWLDFTGCMKDAGTPAACADNKEDYIECLHHRKEMARMRLVAEEAKKQEEAGAGVEAPSPPLRASSVEESGCRGPSSA